MSATDLATQPATGGWTVIIPWAAPVDPVAPTRPKGLLTTPDGDLVVMRAIASVPKSAVCRVIVAFLRETEDRFHTAEALRRASGGTIECLILDERTAGPAETVRQVIARAGVTGPVCIKDSDSFFEIAEMPSGSFMAIADIRTMQRLSDPGRKSYVHLNEQGFICDVVEKDVRSNLISIGLYGFHDAAFYAKTYDAVVAERGEMNYFVSHIVMSAVIQGEIFQPCACEQIVDLATDADWAIYRSAMPTFVLDIDGLIFRNQSKFFRPFWGDPVEPIEKNVAHLLALQANGAQLLFMTARPEAYRETTVTALEALGFRVHALVMGCYHATRYLVNDYAQSNPYPSAIAINVARNTPELASLLPLPFNLDRG